MRQKLAALELITHQVNNLCYYNLMFCAFNASKFGFPWYLLNPHGIKPTFLKFDFMVAGGGFYSYYKLQYIEEDKEIKKKECYA